MSAETEPIDFVVKRASIADPRAQLAQLEFDLLESAMAKAKKASLTAYSRTFREGSYAVPSQTRLGWVHDVDLNWHTGQPISCSCEAHIRYCIHVGAATWTWRLQKDEIDADILARTVNEMSDMLKKEANENGD